MGPRTTKPTVVECHKGAWVGRLATRHETINGGDSLVEVASISSLSQIVCRERGFQVGCKKVWTNGWLTCGESLGTGKHGSTLCCQAGTRGHFAKWKRKNMNWMFCPLMEFPWTSPNTIKFEWNCRFFEDGSSVCYIVHGWLHHFSNCCHLDFLEDLEKRRGEEVDVKWTKYLWPISLEKIHNVTSRLFQYKVSFKVMGGGVSMAKVVETTW